MDAMLTSLNGTAAFITDIIIASETHDEILNCLFCVFEWVQQYGFHVQAVFPDIDQVSGFYI